MRPDEPAALGRVLRRAREAAFAPGEYVGQESFVLASEVLALAGRAGIGPGVSVLDVCCGVAGPGLLVARELGCAYVGVDASRVAVARARRRADRAGLRVRFLVARVPPLPPGPFDVVLLLETMLAFPDKPALLGAVAAALPTGGRFAFTVEEGVPLTAGERAAMPSSHTVWPTPLPELLDHLEGAGMRVRWQSDWSHSHHATVDALIETYAAAAATGPTGAIGSATLDELLASHRLWSAWLRERRVRKLAIVAEKLPPPPDGRRRPVAPFRADQPRRGASTS